MSKQETPNINQRLKEEILSKYKKIKDFADRFDINYNKLRSWTNRGNIPAVDLLHMTKSLGITMDYLLTGENRYENAVTEPGAIYKAAAGRGAIDNDLTPIQSRIAHLFDDLPAKTYRIFEVDGSSMCNTLFHGDKLICRLDTVEKMIDDRVYVLMIESKELAEYRPSKIWVKRCTHRANNGYITCRSDNNNTTEPYTTFQVKCSQVTECWYPVFNITTHLADPNRDLSAKITALESRIELLELLTQKTKLI